MSSTAFDYERKRLPAKWLLSVISFRLKSWYLLVAAGHSSAQNQERNITKEQEREKEKKKSGRKGGGKEREREGISIARTVGLMITSFSVVFCLSLIEIEVTKDRKALDRSSVESSQAILSTCFTTSLLTFNQIRKNTHLLDTSLLLSLSLLLFTKWWSPSEFFINVNVPTLFFSNLESKFSNWRLVLKSKLSDESAQDRHVLNQHLLWK